MQIVAKEKNLTAFAVRLRELREAAGLTQPQAGRGAGVHPQTYMRWERGETEPSFSELCALASLFGKTPNDFLPEDA